MSPLDYSHIADGNRRRTRNILHALHRREHDRDGKYSNAYRVMTKWIGQAYIPTTATTAPIYNHTNGFSLSATRSPSPSPSSAHSQSPSPSPPLSLRSLSSPSFSSFSPPSPTPRRSFGLSTRFELGFDNIPRRREFDAAALGITHTTLSNIVSPSVPPTATPAAHSILNEEYRGMANELLVRAESRHARGATLCMDQTIDGSEMGAN